MADGSTVTYKYDNVGNRKEKEIKKDGTVKVMDYAYNDNNQLTAVNGQAYQYDPNGNRIQDAQFIYEYDEFDKLQTVKNLSGQLVAFYTYDEAGRRVSKTVNDKKTMYHYNQNNQVSFETDSAGEILAEYSYDQKGFPRTFTKDEQTYFYVLNGHRDVIGLTDSSGQTVASYTYDAWGNILTQSGPLSEENPYRYAGYRYDNETSLYYLLARYYNAEEGVFLSIDPLAGDLSQPQTQNGYNYANNNPVMLYDPDGHIAHILAGALVGAFVNAMVYLLSLVNKHGANKAASKINYKTLGITMLKGAASGAIGLGVVAKLKKAGDLGKLATAMLSFNLAPAAYAVGNYGSYSAKGLAENQFLSLISAKNGAYYLAIKPKLQVVIKKYK